MEKICYIIGPCGGRNIKVSACEGDLVIAADGGYGALSNYGISADIVIGDFDSLGYIPSGCKVIRHPERKDDTDSLLAIKYAWDLGYRIFVLLGCCGGQRPDHTVANISSLVWLSERDSIGYLVGEEYAYTVIKNGSIRFSKENTGDISVFSISKISRGVFENGLSYTLLDGELSFDYPMGVSNSFISNDAVVSVKEGTLLIYWQTDFNLLMKTVRSREIS